MRREYEVEWRKWKYLAVNHWRDFQHYRERRPPWIKLHASLLDDYAFATLRDHEKGALPHIFLLASQHGNRIPSDSNWIRTRIGFRRAPNLTRIVQAGFLVEGKEENEKNQTIEKARNKGPNASAPLASRRQSAISETETEIETEGEAESPSSPLKDSPPKGATEMPPPELAVGLNQIAEFDDGAVLQLWRQCQARSPGCTAHDIRELAANLLARKRKIQNIVGFFLKVVPDHFNGNGLARLRARRREADANREANTKKAELEQQAEEKGRARFQELPPAVRERLREEVRAELFKVRPAARTWRPEVLEQTIDVWARKRLTVEAK